MRERKEAMLSDEIFFERFLKGSPWPQESEMDRELTEKIRQEIMDSAEEEERLIAAHPEVSQAEPAPDMLDRILAEAKKKKIIRPVLASERTESRGEHVKDEEKEAFNEKERPGPMPLEESYCPEIYLTEEDRKALEIGRQRLQRGKKSAWMHHWSAIAAVLVCVFLVGVGTEANRTKLVNVLSTWVGEDALVRVNNETDRELVNHAQEKACADIEEQLGIKPVRFMYELKGMDFSGYDIDKTSERAVMFYEYQNTIFTITMQKNDSGLSIGQVRDGEITDNFEIATDIGKVEIAEIEGISQEKYMTEFTYGNVYYEIQGKMPKEEFVHLISSIFF